MVDSSLVVWLDGLSRKKNGKKNINTLRNASESTNLSISSETYKSAMKFSSDNGKSFEPKIGPSSFKLSLSCRQPRIETSITLTTAISEDVSIIC